MGGEPSTLANPNDELLDAILSGLSTLSGVKVTELSALGVATVFSCVNVLSRTVSTLPLVVYQERNGEKHRAPGHPLYDLMKVSPNPEMTAADFLGATMFNLALRNEAFGFVSRNRGGEVTQIVPVLPKDIRRKRDGGSDGNELRFHVKGVPYDAERILDIRGLTNNGLNGVDMLGTVGEVIGLARALQDNAAKFFGNGQKISDVLSTDKALTNEQVNRLREQMLDRKRRGDDYTTLILEEGMKYITHRSENKDSQFQEAREHQDKKIASLWGIPPHKVGILSDATFSNIEHQNIEWVVDCILPYLVRIEQAMNLRLLTASERRQGYYVEFLVEGLLRGDVKSRYEAYAIGRQWGWLSVNDIRRKENMNPIEGGDVYLTPLNMVDSQNPQPQPEQQAA